MAKTRTKIEIRKLRRESSEYELRLGVSELIEVLRKAGLLDVPTISSDLTMTLRTPGGYDCSNEDLPLSDDSSGEQVVRIRWTEIRESEPEFIQADS